MTSPLKKSTKVECILDLSVGTYFNDSIYVAMCRTGPMDL